MGENVAKRLKNQDCTISWSRACEIFGNPQPPTSVWEKQFDYCDDDLKRLANTPYEQMHFSDLWYYYHDLAYVELQAELFAYLFPVCLMDWHFSLMRNEGCSHGDSEFHRGIYQGKIFQKMLTAQQLEEVCEFFRDSFMERLRGEPEFKQAQQIGNDLPECQDLLKVRINELPALLRSPDSTSWTV